jgi:hypothetical protein
MARPNYIDPGADVIGPGRQQPANEFDDPGQNAALDEVPPAQQVLREIGTTLAVLLGAALIGNLFALAIDAAVNHPF